MGIDAHESIRRGGGGTGVGFSLGRARVKRKLDNVAKQIGPEISGAMAAQADLVVRQMQSKVAFRTGALHDSTGWTWGEAPAGAVFKVSSSRKAKIAGAYMRLTIFSGSAKAFWARWVEFGTKARPPGAYRDARNRRRNAGKTGHRATAPKPYFWPTWRANKKPVMAAIRKAMRAAIKKGVTIH
jgi:hypothetical protein